jgi:membrane protein YqaA with SNARE-associated domain
LKRVRDVLVGWGPLGLFALAAIESAGIPNPGGTDAVLLLLTIAGQNWLLCAFVAAAGSLIGSLVFYEITRKGGEALLAKYTSSGRGARFKRWYQRYGLVTVFIAALVPIPVMPFKVFAACAGALGVKRTRYVAVLALARVPRYLGLAYLGAQFGENSTAWLKLHVWHLAGLALALGVLLFALVRWSDRERVPAIPH